MGNCETVFDSDIELQIYAACDQIEKDTQRQILNATYEHNQDCFGDYVELKMRPITSVQSVTYLDTDGVSQTLDAADWRFDQSRQWILPAAGETFPTTLEDLNAVTVTYTAGYGADADCIPRLLKQGIMLLVANWFMDPASESTTRIQGLPAYERLVNLLQVGIYP